MTKAQKNKRLDCLVLGSHDPRILEGSIERKEVNRRLQSKALSDVGRALRSNEAFQNVKIGEEFMGPTVALSHLRSNPESDSIPLYTEWELPMPAILLLVTHLSRRGLHAEGINFLTPNHKLLLEKISEEPRAIAVTTTYYTVPFAGAQIVQFLKIHAPGIPIVLGGPMVDALHKAYDPKKLSRLFDIIGADYYIVEGEGEKTLASLVTHLRNGEEAIHAVPNLFFKSGAEWKFTERIVENNPMEESTVDWELFPPNFGVPSINVRTARSCAFKCSFCDFPLRFPKLETQPVEVVEAEIRKLVHRGTKHIIFIDDTFNVPTERFDEILKMIIRNDFDIRWYSFFRLAVTRSPETYELMRKSGCGGVFLGMESGDPTVLKNMNKSVGMDRMRFGMEQLRKHGILCDAGLMTGFPGETEKTVQNTIDFINETGPTFYANQIWFYSPQTPIQKEAEKYGLTGFGYSWKHHTMDSEKAIEAVEYSRAQIKNSRVTTAGNPGFWMIPYLRGKGMSESEILAFHDLLNEGFRHNSRIQSAGAPADPKTSDYIARFTNFARGLRLQKAEYQLNRSPSPFVAPSYLEKMDQIRQEIEALAGERAGR